MQSSHCTWPASLRKSEREWHPLNQATKSTAWLGVGGSQGTLADFVAVDADLLALKPRTLSMREAAALPLITITAWEGLVDRAKVHTGQTVLIP